MIQFRQKSGRKKTKRRDLARVYHESVNKASTHFSTLFLQRLKNVREVRLWVVEWVLLVAVVLILAIVQNIWYSSSYEMRAYGEGGGLSEATLGKISSMNPLYATTNSEKTLAKLLFADLVAPDAAGKNRAELAESVTRDETAKLWTVKLREGIEWSDGEAITADDVIYTVGLLMDSSAKTTISVNLTRVKVEKVDERTVNFLLPAAYADFMDSLRFPLVPEHILGKIKPALVYESDFSENPVGSGPFVLNAMQVAGGNDGAEQTIYLNRNEKYFKSKTKLATFTLKTYEKLDDIAVAVRSAAVSATAELGARQAENLSRLERRTSLINSGAFAFLNTQSDVLKETKVRQALRKGIDMAKVRNGLDETQRLDYPILAQQEAELAYPKLAATNLKEAKEMLAGVEGLSYDNDGKLVNADGEQINLRVVAQDYDMLGEVAERLGEQIEQLGIGVKLEKRGVNESAADFFKAVVMTRDYDILVYEVDLGVNTDPFVYYSSTQASETGRNFSNYRNSLVDDALLSARTTTNEALRKSKLELFLKHWVEDVPAIGLYQIEMNYYFNTGVLIYSDESRLTDALDRFEDVRYWASEQKTVELTP